MRNVSVMPNKKCQFSNKAMALLAAGGVDVWRRLMLPVWDGYHPERHYMRGPGPKSRARALAAKVPEHASARRPGNEPR